MVQQSLGTITQVRSDIKIVDSKGGLVRYLFIDGQNVAVIDGAELVLRKPVSEERLAVLQKAIGKLKISGPPIDVPEEFFY